MSTDYSTEAVRKSAQLQSWILAWMKSHRQEHIDPETGEVNATSLVEDWDRCCATGGVTLDSDHPAWEIALRVRP